MPDVRRKGRAVGEVAYPAVVGAALDGGVRVLEDHGALGGEAVGGVVVHAHALGVRGRAPGEEQARCKQSQRVHIWKVCF